MSENTDHPTCPRCRKNKITVASEPCWVCKQEISWDRTSRERPPKDGELVGMYLTELKRLRERRQAEIQDPRSNAYQPDTEEVPF